MAFAKLESITLGPAPREHRIVRLHRCLEMIGLAKSTLYDLSNPKSPRFDPTFPPKVKIGTRAVGWFEDDVFYWLESKRPRTKTNSESPP